MKILIISDPYIPVPPNGYGGIERIIELLTLQFIKDKHEVTLLAGPNSVIHGARLFTYGKNIFPPKRKDKIFSISFVWSFLWKSRNKFDLVINFGRLVNLLPLLRSESQKISCYQREISQKNVKAILRLPFKNLRISGCSHDLIRRSSLEHLCTSIHNCVDFSKYNLVDNCSADAPLIFLGRLERIKGVHTAIEVARKTSNKLIIAGNISPLVEEQAYFKEEIEPNIDGKNIIYVGAVNDVQKNEYLGKSKALLFPIEWDEPFGIVMIESMACGTPVIGIGRGSVPEVVDHGVSGFVVNSQFDIIEALEGIHKIERKKCREQAQKRFDVSVIANKYLNLFS